MNEKLILETLSRLVETQATQMDVNASFAELLESRLPELSPAQKKVLLDGANSMRSLALIQRAGLTPLQEALEDL